MTSLLPRGTYRALMFLAPCGGVVGLLLEVPALSILSGGILLLMLAAGLYVGVVGRRVVVSRRAPDGACQDDVVTVSLRVVNRGRLPAPLLEVGDEFGPALNTSIRLAVPATLRPQYQYALEYEGTCFRRRGAYGIGPMWLQVRDPMGWFARRRAVEDIHPFDVFPRIVPLEGICFPGGRPGQSCESESLPRAGHSMLVLGAREYFPGDEVRDIHWPATARFGRPIVKEREFDRPPMVTLVLDLDERHFEGLGQRSTIEFQVSIAASLALAVTRQRGAFQVIADKVRLPVGSGPLQLEAFLHQLVTLSPKSRRPIGEVMGGAIAEVPPRSVVVPFVAGLDLDPAPLAEAIEALAGAGCAVRAIVLDDATFLKRKARAPGAGETRMSVAGLVESLHAAGAEACVIGADDDPSVRVREIFEGVRR